MPRKEKRQYKKRKHKTDSRGGNLDDTGVRSGTGSGGGRGTRPSVLGSGLDPLLSSDEDSPLPSHSHTQPSLPSDRDDEDTADEGQFAFRRNRNSTYLPVSRCLYAISGNIILTIISVTELISKRRKPRSAQSCTK